MLKAIYSGLFIMTPPRPPPTFVLEEELIQYKYNLMQFLSNLSKVILSQKTADILSYK